MKTNNTNPLKKPSERIQEIIDQMVDERLRQKYSGEKLEELRSDKGDDAFGFQLEVVQLGHHFITDAIIKFLDEQNDN